MATQECIKKRCGQCRAFKPLDQFSRDRTRQDGFYPNCKQCKSDAKRDYYIRNRESALARTGANYRKNREQRLMQDRERRKRPEVQARIRELSRDSYASKGRAWANRVLQHEIRSGRMVRASECQRCGAHEQIHAHHDDYEKPLDVMWLCQPCHVEADKARRRREAFNTPGFDYEQLDPGVREVVRLLHQHGFVTTDSGDGVSKPQDEIEIPSPHVVCTVKPAYLLNEADNLAGLLGSEWTVEATYYPGNPIAILLATKR